MANEEHLARLKQGVQAWNQWRVTNRDMRPNFFRADLTGADLTGADLTEANLAMANLCNANLSGANLSRAHLEGSISVGTNFVGANLTGCWVYGISARNVNLAGAQQSDLIITLEDESTITVDYLDVAQLLYLLLHNENIRQVIDTIGKKGVLILGRFAGERKAVLDALRTALRQHDFLPIVFHMEKPTQRDFTETIMTLAGLSVFVIADITNPQSVPLELQATVPDYMVPFVPILAEGETPFSMFIDLQRRFDWVLDVLAYDSIAHLMAGLEGLVIAPALQKHTALVQRRAWVMGTRHIPEFIGHGGEHPSKPRNLELVNGGEHPSNPANPELVNGGEHPSKPTTVGSEIEPELINFAAFAPRSITPASTFILDIWAYFPFQYSRVSEMATELSRDVKTGQKIGVPIARERY